MSYTNRKTQFPKAPRALCTIVVLLLGAVCGQTARAQSSGSFQAANGRIIDPNGQPFIARGVNVLNGGSNPSAAKLQADFPGINFVRLAIYKYDDPSTLAASVNDLTSHGIVVELENHNNGAGNAGGSKGVIFTGNQLVQESNWYTSVASYFKSNPYVWFGTNNEPSETLPDGTFSPAALSTWQQQTYQAVRSTGNNNPILLEANGWRDGNTGQPVMVQGYTASVYAPMTNIVWDIHFYGWLLMAQRISSTTTRFWQA